MDVFVTRKRRRLSASPEPGPTTQLQAAAAADQESTDVKLAILLSLFPDAEQHDLLDILVSHDGSVEAATAALSAAAAQQQRNTKKRIPSSLTPTRSTSTTPRIQSSLTSYTTTTTTKTTTPPRPKRPTPTKKGQTLHLYSPGDIAQHTPCTLIPNFLAADEADALLAELVAESATFERHAPFQLFERTVRSPHSSALYCDVADEQQQQQQQQQHPTAALSEYIYNGTHRRDVRRLTPRMRRVSAVVQTAVNAEIARRIRERYPGARKLRYQSPREWVPNAAVVNCYDGPAESVGYHSDELTYLGPRAVIGSLSLGVEREFRVRRVVPDDNNSNNNDNDDDDGNANGQISIHLPHNSLLVMHAEMQEEWKHCVPPARTISPHPVAGNRRINITYRWYRESLHPRFTPRCRCGVPAVLRCVQRRRETRGRYMWMCYAGHAPGRKGCPFFQWAEFDDDGEPIWRRTEGDGR
ncbi:hypothetical protein VTN02DRAFT_6544 [Thermoascus thermophilus]